MLLFRFVAAAQQLKTLTVTSFTVPTFQLHEIPFSMKSQLLTVANIDQDEIKIIQTLLYGNLTYSVNDNKLILDASIKSILETKRFDGPVLQVKESRSIHNCQNGSA